jgi:hypothetical protein
VIAGHGGHHNRGGFKPTQEAYADIQHQVARVVYGEDAHGVWFSGAVCPGVEAETVAAIRGSGVSGHWERPAPGHPRELLGSVLVNIPGFAQAASHRIVASATFTPTGGIVITPEIGGDDNQGNGEVDPRLGRRITAAGSSITAAAQRLVPVSGVLAALGTPTVDGRQVMDAQWGELPLPLWYKRAQGGWGHDGAVIVGRIDELIKDGSLVRFNGVIEEGIEESINAEVVASLGVLGISMDGRPAPDSEIEVEYDDDGWPEMVTFHLYEILGATLTSGPAFQETIGVKVGEESDTDEDEMPDDEEGSDDAPDVIDDDSVAASAEPGYTTIKLPIVWH